jgi:hypothetical protein
MLISNLSPQNPSGPLSLLEDNIQNVRIIKQSVYRNLILCHLMKRNKVVKLSSSSPDISVFLSIELPFWVSIESGVYSLDSDTDFRLCNDYWLVATGNLVDGPFDKPFEYIVNETRVDDQDFLDRITGKSGMYYHKKKMKTTFTRGLVIQQAKISAEVRTEKGQRQLEKIVFHHVSVERCEQFLNDINSSLDYYCTLVSPLNPTREARRVSFYETKLRVLVALDSGGVRYLYSTQITPDERMADFPYPRFRVQRIGGSQVFKDLIQTIESPSFHQLQWTKTLNHNREQRHQEALLDAAITLETLVHLYLIDKGYKNKDEREAVIRGKKRNRGLAGWLKSLDISNLNDECDEVADLWTLRNDFVHEQKKLSEKEIRTIRKGIQSLTKLREFFLEKADTELLEKERKFSEFLEPIQLGTAVTGSIKGRVPIQIEWRLEKDHYQTAYNTQIKTNERDP